MAEASSFDVAVVGASVAGCAAATLLAREGLRVALLEKNRGMDAYKKVCTHYLQPGATPVLKRLGVDGAIEAAGGVRNAIDLWTPAGWLLRADHLPHGYNIRREKLDPILRRQAAATPGVTLLSGHMVQGVLTEGGQVRGLVAREAETGQTRELRARLVVGADGRASPVARLAGVGESVSRNARFIYFAQYKHLPLSSGRHSQLWFLERGVAYAFTNDDGVTVMACMFDKEELPRWREDLEGCFLRAVGELPDGPRVAEAERISPVLGMTDLPLVRRQAGPPGLAFVGDAQLASDPLWGVGCGWALMSAEWLSDFVSEPLRRGEAPDAAVARYQRHHRAELRGHEFQIAWFATGRPLNWLERRYMQVATWDGVLAERMHAFAARTIGFTDLIAPRYLARMLWGLLRPP